MILRWLQLFNTQHVRFLFLCLSFCLNSLMYVPIHLYSTKLAYKHVCFHVKLLPKPDCCTCSTIQTMHLLHCLNCMLSAYDCTLFASALHLSLCLRHVCRLYTRMVQRVKHLYVLLVLASVPYMSLFVYDTVCIGSPGTTSASGITSACGIVKVTLQTMTKVNSPTPTRRGGLQGGGSPTGQVQK